MLYAAKWSASAARRFSRFRLKAFVRRVKRRMDMRMCRFVRSTCEVQIRSSSGFPEITTFSALIIAGGE